MYMHMHIHMYVHMYIHGHNVYYHMRMKVTRLKGAFRNYVTVVLPEFYEYGTGTLF